MKIDNSLKSIGPANSGGTGKSANSDAPKAEAGVSVELSGLSSELQALGSNQPGGAVVDAARVSDIKQAIAEGLFKINADVVADRLLQTVRELIGSYKH